MLHSALVLSILALVIDDSLATNSLAFRRHLSSDARSNGKTLAHADRDRVAQLTRRASGHERHYRKRYSTIPATSLGVAYTASVGVGSPPTQYSECTDPLSEIPFAQVCSLLIYGTPPLALFIDSGSANTWIGHNKSYTPTSTSYATTDKLSITYGDGTVNGPEYLDQITLSPSLVVKNQSIGVDDRTGDFATHGGITLDGILGIGPVSQTAGTLTTRPANYTVPTVTYVLNPDYISETRQPFSGKLTVRWWPLFFLMV